MTLARQHRRPRRTSPKPALLRKLGVVAVAMFGFGFALVPFYEKICEVTGIRNLAKPDACATPRST